MWVRKLWETGTLSPLLFQYQGLRWHICTVWRGKNSQQYSHKLEDLPPTVLEAKLAGCLFKAQIFQEQWWNRFGREKYIPFHPRPRSFKYSDVCLVWWLGFEEVRCFTAIALWEQGSCSIPILQAGKLGHPSAQLLERGSWEQSLKRIPSLWSPF